MDRPVVTVSPDGQVAQPASIRDALQWPAGTRLVVESTPGGVHLRAEENKTTGIVSSTEPRHALVKDKQASLEVPVRTASEVAGILKYKGPRISLKDMEEAIEIEVQRRHDLGRY